MPGCSPAASIPSSTLGTEVALSESLEALPECGQGMAPSHIRLSREWLTQSVSLEPQGAFGHISQCNT